MTDQPPDRLDRMEHMLAVLITHTDATDRRINQLADNQLLIQQDLSLLTNRLDRLGGRVDQLTDGVNRLTGRVEQVSDRVDQVAATIEAIGQQAEQDRSQAAIDRAEFRSTVQQILDALQVRFGGNGHASD